MESLVAQSERYDKKLREVRQGRQFNLYFTALATLGAVVSISFDAAKDTIAGWTLGSGVGLLADKASNFQKLQAAYEDGISKLGCVSREAQPFTETAVVTQASRIETSANNVGRLIDAAEAAVAATSVTSDDALRQAIADARTAIGKSNALLAAIAGAPTTIRTTGGVIDDQVQAAERGAAVDLKALVDALVALKVAPTATAPPKTTAGAEAPAAMLAPTDELTAAQYTQQIKAETARLNAINGRMDYVAAREHILACATKT